MSNIPVEAIAGFIVKTPVEVMMAEALIFDHVRTPRGIIGNVVAPGYFPTAMTAQVRITGAVLPVDGGLAGCR